MPVVDGKRVLNSSPQYQSSLNARGGINRVSQRELSSQVAAGSTSRMNALEIPVTPRPTTGFSVQLPDTVPAEALNGNVGRADVRSMRDNLEQSNLATEQFNTDFSNLTGRIGNTTLSSPFVNPEATLNRLLLRGTTDTQQALDAQGQTQADNIRGFANEYTQAGTDARTQFRLPELQQELGNTRTQIAERRVKLRETLRDFETNAERRGVAREFVDSEKAKVQADAATELADLAIIETAQLGNVNEAKDEVDSILAEKKQAFEFENAAIEAEIARLEKMDTRESAARSEQLKIALDERTRNIETALANEKEQRGYMVDAAANGADQGTLAAIRNAKSPQEAAFLASPFIGRLDRMAQEANIAQSYASAASSRLTAQKTQLEIDALKGIETGNSNIAVQALDSFSGALNENNRQQYTTAVTGAVKRGNIEQTELALKNAAQSAAGSALREDVIKRDQAIGALRNVQKELDAYTKAGGNTNLLTGGYEDLQNKLGKTSDPKLASIETRINLALNAYTNAVSGASFTPQESERYASLFPKKSNTNELNNSKIATLVDSFEANNQVFYGNFFGGQTPSQIAEQAVYDELIANATPEQLKELGIQ